MGSEVPSAVLFSEGRSPEENSRQWKEPKAHRFNWCLEKRNDIFVLYPSSTTFMEASSYFHVFMLVTFLLILLRLRACMHVHRPKCSLSNSKLILTSNAALSMSILNTSLTFNKHLLKTINVLPVYLHCWCQCRL